MKWICEKCDPPCRFEGLCGIVPSAVCEAEDWREVDEGQWTPPIHPKLQWVLPDSVNAVGGYEPLTTQASRIATFLEAAGKLQSEANMCTALARELERLERE